MTTAAALILVNGVLPSVATLERAMSIAALTVCADGAANLLCAVGREPQVVIGDLDSLTDATRSVLATTCKVVSRPSQESTDLEKAFEYCIECGFAKVMVAGMQGDRFDHAVTNLSILYHYSSAVDITIIDNNGWGEVLNAKPGGSSKEFTAEDLPLGTQVSIISLAYTESVTTSGLLYSLTNEPLSWGGRQGQSNSVIAPTITVKVQDGGVLVWINQSFLVAASNEHFC